jgi:RsiW-degrading membrane proteinase PrsW (M82 family)
VFVYFATFTLLGPIVFYVFREILPGNSAMIQSPNYVKVFIGMFFAAGLAEEFIKVFLVLIGALFTLRAADIKAKIPVMLFDALRIRGPLDGLMMGLFGGAGFILVETWGQYVPRIVNSVMQQSQNDMMAAGTGLMLLFPRVVGGIVGHMAWAGITGYFIGLAVLRQKQAAKLVLIGWLLTSAIHAFWNTSQFSSLIMPVAALAGGVLFIACLLKARQLEGSIGRSATGYGSIVVDRPPVSPLGTQPMPVGARPATPTNPLASAGAASAGAAPAGAASASGPAANLGGGAPIAVVKTMRELKLEVAGTRLSLSPGGTIDFARDTSLGAAATGISGEVTRHPTREDVLGLRNTGTINWTARLRDGTQHVIEPNRNLRLAAGIEVAFGAFSATVVEL